MANYKKYFTKVIRDRYPERSGYFIANVENHYDSISLDTEFAAFSTNPIDKRLDFCAYFLALIKTLDEQGETYENIRKHCLEIVTEYVRPKNKMQVLLKRLPGKLANTWLSKYVLIILGRAVSERSHKDGFVAKIITDKNETFGFGYGVDIIECGICKLFNKHNYQKYSSILCEVDELTSSLAGLTLVRTGTIALGAKKCDFRFKKRELAGNDEKTLVG